MKPVRFSAACRRVLLAFEGQKSTRIAALAAKLKRSRSGICRHLKRLHSAEMVQRVRLANGRQSLVFYTSPKGQHLVQVWTGKSPTTERN